MFPSSDFIAKNQLASKGSQSLSLVTIPALTTFVDRQFKRDRTLCLVQALRYYLDRRVSIPTFHFLQEKTHLRYPYSLFLVKTNILLCYKEADQQAFDLVQVKVHDIRNLQWGISGLSLESSQFLYKFLPERPYLVR